MPFVNAVTRTVASSPPTGITNSCGPSGNFSFGDSSFSSTVKGRSESLRIRSLSSESRPVSVNADGTLAPTELRIVAYWARRSSVMAVTSASLTAELGSTAVASSHAVRSVLPSGNMLDACNPSSVRADATARRSVIAASTLSGRPATISRPSNSMRSVRTLNSSSVTPRSPCVVLISVVTAASVAGSGIPRSDLATTTPLRSGSNPSANSSVRSVTSSAAARIAVCAGPPTGESSSADSAGWGSAMSTSASSPMRTPVICGKSRSGSRSGSWSYCSRVMTSIRTPSSRSNAAPPLLSGSSTKWIDRLADTPSTSRSTSSPLRSHCVARSG